MSAAISNRARAGCLIAIALLVTIIAYSPGLDGPFIFDDIPNIVQNEAIKITSLEYDGLLDAMMSGNSGPLKRPISMVSFAANHYLSGLDPKPYKYTNLIIHLTNGTGIFFLSLLLLNTAIASAWHRLNRATIVLLSISIATVWLLHPLNLTSVLYVVQRMTSLAATFAILAMIFYLVARNRSNANKPFAWPLTTCVTLILLSIFSKETGLLIPLYLLIIEVIFFRFNFTCDKARASYVIFFGILLVAPLLALAIYTLTSPQWISSGYLYRDFTLPERLFTEARVLFYYIGLILAPLPSELSLYHDDIKISTSLLSPPTTFFSIIGLATLFVYSVSTIKQHPIFAFGVIFFLSGHLLESTIYPLEIAHEHRNYLPSFGLIFLLVSCIARAATNIKPLLLAGILLTTILLLLYCTYDRSSDWSSTFRLTLSQLAKKPLSPRANYEAGVMHAYLAEHDTNNPDQHYSQAILLFSRTANLDPTSTSPLFSLIILQSRLKQPHSTAVIDDLIKRLKQTILSRRVITQFNSLIRCQAEGLCDLESKTLLTLIESAQQNKQNNSKMRAHIHFVYTNYYFNIEKDTKMSLRHATEAVQLWPNYVPYLLNLAKLQFLAGNPEAGMRSLEKARSLDQDRTYSGLYSEIENIANTNPL